MTSSIEIIRARSLVRFETLERVIYFERIVNLRGGVFGMVLFCNRVKEIQVAILLKFLVLFLIIFKLWLIIIRKMLIRLLFKLDLILICHLHILLNVMLVMALKGILIGSCFFMPITIKNSVAFYMAILIHIY